MRVSAAACSSVMPLRSRCARSCSPRLGICLISRLRGRGPWARSDRGDALTAGHASLRSANGAPAPSLLTAKPLVARLRIILGHSVYLAHLPGALRRSDDAVLFHDVDEPARARETDRHLPLEHRHRRLARALHDLDGLLVAVVVDLIATVVADPRALLVLDDREVVVGLALLSPMTDDLLDLRVGYEGSLRADRLRRVRGQPEHVAT